MKILAVCFYAGVGVSLVTSFAAFVAIKKGTELAATASRYWP